MNIAPFKINMALFLMSIPIFITNKAFPVTKTASLIMNMALLL
jgi:hypothetical protein